MRVGSGGYRWMCIIIIIMYIYHALINALSIQKRIIQDWYTGKIITVL